MRTADKVVLDAGGEAEKLAEELQKGCPAFFREDDRIFYRASGLLQQAESGSSSPAERADLAREALRLMMQASALPSTLCPSAQMGTRSASSTTKHAIHARAQSCKFALCLGVQPFNAPIP